MLSSFRVAAIASAVLFAAFTFAAAAAEDPPPEFPEPIACAIQPDDPSIAPAEKGAWSECEKWVWSCIKNGREANLFTKQCVIPRTSEQYVLRKKFRLAPFFKPERYATDNALSDRFLLTILQNPAYTEQIPAVGIRIFGAYFDDPVNLENVSTRINLVNDGAMMRLGLRMTNFTSTRNVSVDGSNIRGSFYLMRARIDGSLFMERGVFDTVDIRDARIGSSVEGTGSVFTSEFQFDRADIDGKLILTKARLTVLKGWDARVGGSLELRLADVRRKIDLTGARIQGDLRMQDVTFGRQLNEAGGTCDWDPAIDASYVLNELNASLKGEDLETALREVMVERPRQGGKIADNPCSKQGAGNISLVKNEVLLRDMKIEGTLCIVDTTGAITVPPGAKSKSIESISLDGTEAKSTVLGWKGSSSTTLWRAVNYKTGYMVINLNRQPANHHIDNLDIGFISFSRRPLGSDKLEDIAGQSDEHLVKYKCELTPTADAIDAADSRDTQARIAQFFTTDKSGSAQPFAKVVERLDASSVDTLELRKALSDFRYRNACTYSEFSRTRRDRPWLSAKAAMTEAFANAPANSSPIVYRIDQTARMGLDLTCSAAYAGLREMVYYGHETWRISVFIAGAIVLFWALLKFDSVPPGGNMMRRRFGLSYAFDNLIPLRAYRMEPAAADELPNAPWLRVYRVLHRGLGLLFVILIFLFVYKSSTN